MHCLETIRKINNPTVTINVVLNVGDKEPKDQLALTVSLLRLINYRVETGERDGIKERVVVARIPSSTKLQRLEDVTVALRQEAIAVKTSNGGYLVCNPTMNVDISFDSEFFIEF